MKQYCRKQKREMLLLCKDSILIGSEPAEYRLYAHGKQEMYVFCLRLGRERKVLAVGNDIAYALSFYKLMLKGKVTPCTLEDILEDFGEDGFQFKHEKNISKSLYFL